MKSDLLPLNSYTKILQLIQKNQMISRADIAEYLGITRSGVTIAVNEMLKKNMVEEAGEIPNNSNPFHKGRRKILLKINKNYKFAMGTIIEEQFVSIGMSNLQGEILSEKHMNLSEKTDYKEIIKFIINAYSEIITENCIDKTFILGMGIGISPDMRKKMNVDISGSVPEYTHLNESIKKYIPCLIIYECSVTMTALANIDFSNDIQYRCGNNVFFQFGSIYSLVIVCGSSIIEEVAPNSDMIEGCIVNTSSSAGNGSVKSEISRQAVIQKVKNIFSAENTPALYMITNGNKFRITINDIYNAMEKGDSQIIDIYRQCLEMLCFLINNIICVSYADRIILHNTYLGKNDFDYIKNKVSQKYGSDIAKRIVLSKIDKKNSFLGGSAYIIRKLFYGM